MRLPRFMGMLLTSGTALLYPRAAALADMEVMIPSILRDASSSIASHSKLFLGMMPSVVNAIRSVAFDIVNFI